MSDKGLDLDLLDWGLFLKLEKEREEREERKMKRKERGNKVHFAPTLARTHTGDTKLDGAKWKSDNKFTTDWDEMRRVDFNRRVADPNRDIGKEGHLPSNIGGKRKTIKSKKKSKKRFRKTRSKGGKATLPTNNNRRRSDLHDPALEDDEELVGFDENFDFDEDNGGVDEDDDGVVDIEHDITVFEESLHQTIVNVCLSYAEQIADESSDYNSDSDSDSESEATISISQMNDEQLKKRAVCEELVYGEYNIGHIGLLQQYRDRGTIGRLTDADKERIYRDSHHTISNWFRVQQETHGRANGNILEFYRYVCIDILDKIRIAFLPPPPPLIPQDVGGKRIKKQRRTRKSVKRKIKKSKRKKSVKRRKRITKKHKIII